MSRRLLAMVGCLVLLTGSWAAQGTKPDKDAPPKTAAQGAVPEIGELTLDYTFKNFITGDGRTSMMDFRGSVVLVDWWGTH